MATLDAMREGREIIYQARLEAGEFAGYADFLFRVEGSSDLGTYHYEVWDTKLARSLKPYFAIQLCCYAEMLEAMQGRRPAHIGVVLGNGSREKLQTNDYIFYYRSVKQTFLDQQRSFNQDQAPALSGTSDYRHWTGHVTRILEERDDLSFIANIRGADRKAPASGDFHDGPVGGFRPGRHSEHGTRNISTVEKPSPAADRVSWKGTTSV